MENIERSLARFHELARANQLANPIVFEDWYTIITTIDNCFVSGGSNLANPQSPLCAVLFLRCQYAFKAAAGLALAGQVTETFVMLRSVLEYAGYALLIHKDPQLANVWQSRHFDTSKKRSQKDAFKISNVKAAVKRCDVGIANIFDEMYERTIDFGGHPNPHGVYSALHLDENGPQISFTALALSSDVKMVSHALKSTAQIGLTALHIFQHIFTEKFEQLGICEVMRSLEATGKL